MPSRTESGDPGGQKFYINIPAMLASYTAASSCVPSTVTAFSLTTYVYITKESATHGPKAHFCL
jgi:hypothetical protein